MFATHHGTGVVQEERVMEKLHTPQETLRRLASRVLDVVARNKERSPAIAQFEVILPPVVTRFTGLYDSVRLHESSRERKYGEGLAAVQALIRSVQEWRGLLAHDIAAFAALDFDTRVPADVIASADRLQQLLEERQAGADKLAYGDQLLVELGEARAAAAAAWTAAESTRIAHQQLQTEARDAASAFNRTLIALRRTLRSTLGTSHFDYQNLRASRGERDEPARETGTPAVTPTPSTVPAALATREPGTNPLFRSA